ncbi:unnamed protein product [Moneuplotes crassus]|uniref:Uncharacterized protein n=1 Tax=Euplotes crassus TaxID=5936 RepID=A0AAD1TZX6_EUPCR|nr:unnamed protein product [Moneuplotes crassus]
MDNSRKNSRRIRKKSKSRAINKKVSLHQMPKISPVKQMLGHGFHKHNTSIDLYKQGVLTSKCSHKKFTFQNKFKNPPKSTKNTKNVHLNSSFLLNENSRCESSQHMLNNTMNERRISDPILINNQSSKYLKSIPKNLSGKDKNGHPASHNISHLSLIKARRPKRDQIQSLINRTEEDIQLKRLDSDSDMENFEDIEESKDGIISKDNNIGNMLNNSRNNFGGSSRRKLSYTNAEGMNLVQRVNNLNKTHDYHHSALNLHSTNLKLLGREDDQKFSNFRSKYQQCNPHEISLGNFKHAIKRSSNSRSSTRYAKNFETFPNALLNDKSITKYVDTSQLLNNEEPHKNAKSQNKIHDNEEVKLFTDDEFDEDEFYIRPDEEIMITPSTDSKHMSRIYQDALNQQSDSVEKPLKRVSKLSGILDSSHKSEYQKSSSNIVPKIELSLIPDNQYTENEINLGKCEEDQFPLVENIDLMMLEEELDQEEVQPNLQNRNNLITFDSKCAAPQVEANCGVGNLENSLRILDKQIGAKIHLTSDFGCSKKDAECQVNIKDPEMLIKRDKEVMKWKKAFQAEQKNNKLTRTVLDQALALSMKLLNEVKALDIKLYKETEKNKQLVGIVTKNDVEIDRGDGTPLKMSNEKDSGSSCSHIIRKSTEEIENIIRKIQFDSDKKRSAEKPPQVPRFK